MASSSTGRNNSEVEHFHIPNEAQRRLRNIVRYASNHIILPTRPVRITDRSYILDALNTRYAIRSTSPGHLDQYSDGQLYAAYLFLNKYVYTNMGKYQRWNDYDHPNPISLLTFDYKQKKVFTLAEAVIQELKEAPVPEPLRADEVEASAPPRPSLPPPSSQSGIDSRDRIESEIRRVRAMITGLQNTLNNLETVREDLLNQVYESGFK